MMQGANIMKQLALLISAFCLENICLAQQLKWQHLNGPMGGIIGDIAINSKGYIYAGAYAFATGYTGLYKSVDNGETWQKIPTQFDDFEVYAIYLTQADHIFVGTNHQGRIYRSLDDGQTWENTNNGYNSGECWAFGEDQQGNLFAGDGEFGGVFKSSDYGTSWSWVADLFPLTFASAANGIIYCGSFLGLFASRDQGETWAQNNLLANIPVSTILLDNNNVIYAGTGYHNNGDGVYFSSDGGLTWTQLGLDDKVVLSLAFDLQGNLYAGTLSDGLYMTPDKGKTWQQYTSGLYRKQVFRLKLNRRDHIFIGSENEGVFRSTDSGQNFQQVGLPTSKVNNLVFSGDSLILVATPSGVQGYHRFSGEWKNLGLQEVEAVAIGPAAELYAATFREGLYRSTDLGQTWTQTRLTENQLFSIYNVKVLHDGTVLAATENRLQRSTDHGETWSTLLPKHGYFYRGMAIDSDHDIWVGAFGARNSVVYKSTNEGATFDSVFCCFGWVDQNGIATAAQNIFLVDPLGGADFGGIHRSTDDGLSWEKISSERAWSIHADKDGRVYAGGLYHLLFSSDNGKNWTNMPYPMKRDDVVREMEEDAEDNLFFGSFTEGLYQVTLITEVEEKKNSFVASYMLSQNHPNPFNPATMIHYSIPKRDRVELKVYDAMGKEIATLVEGFQTAGEHRVEFDGARFPSGLYFYSLKSGEFVQTKKMILVK